ncbi:serine/arginine repetitive matrix protein 1-like isoform X3 [Anoplophora glabripennis]|uniref:serine/arginine repetitive matrix protein 1-like isoform X3 n=1 Tax=Anoplophora glabripennis TaxID=217634 RepID=UPI000873F86A|nr:serine/arginine repetitive matrix protein 1-like isoform X3 [Anoplophora glabripennis]
MVVIVFVKDPSGQHLPNIPKKRVTYSSRIFIKPSLFCPQVEPGETIATTKEEEWVSKKKTEVTNTKQIETRVKRQVILEDGKIVEDTGPMVTTNTTEDSETQEHHQTELRKLGDDETDGPLAVEGGDSNAVVEKSNWVAVANPDGIVREVKERKVISREETEEVKETEDVQHLGDITDEEFLAAVQTGSSDLRKVLRSSETGRTLVSTGPRVVHESQKSNKVTDTEETRELSSVLPDGKIVTETQRTTEHEEVRDDELPEGSPDQDLQKESSERYLKTRDQEDVDYVADGVNIGHEMRFKTETMEVERRGDGVDEPDFFESLSTRAKRRVNNRQQPHRYRGVSEWSERRQEQHYISDRQSPLPYRSSPSYEREYPRRSPIPDYRPSHSPSPDYRPHYSPSPDYTRPSRISPKREVINITPTPPQRKKTLERQRQRVVEERSRYENGYRSGRLDDRDQRIERMERMEEPPPDYSPPSPPPMPIEKKHMQKTRFAADPPPKAKSGNIIGQSIRKLVGKIRSASAERKARQRAKRSPSPSYQQGHVIDNNIGHNMDRHPPVQRYYLGEDPFAGSIYGRENKYDGVKPARTSRRPREIQEERR